MAPTPGNLANSDQKSFLIIYNLKFYCTDIRMVVVPAFTYGKEIGAKILWPKKCAPKLRKSCKQNKRSEYYFYIFFKQFPIEQVFWIFLLPNIIYLLLQTGWGRGGGGRGGAAKIHWPGQLAPRRWRYPGLGSLPPLLETWQNQIRKTI